MAKPPVAAGKKHRFGKAWMHEHLTDHFVHEAQRLGYRSRAAFKLLEIAERDGLLRPGMLVADLGAAPGSWSQVLAERLGPRGEVFALDLLPMDPVPRVRVLQGDFGDEETLRRFVAAIGNRKLDLVVSDMAPNISGVASVDQARSLHLAELALEFAQQWLKPGGDFVVKLFQGAGAQEFQRQVASSFERLQVRKPKASRDRSREMFLVGRGFLG